MTYGREHSFYNKQYDHRNDYSRCRGSFYDEVLRLKNELKEKDRVRWIMYSCKVLILTKRPIPWGNGVLLSRTFGIRSNMGETPTHGLNPRPNGYGGLEALDIRTCISSRRQGKHPRGRFCTIAATPKYLMTVSLLFNSKAEMAT